ncbi:uncharacterized protein FIBRA_04374 [Fibroporia radiculosa]|uniref:Uncharacterized protein n=1 Tax=Fibroporia radiculosa TaxID=599839 RepID=J4IA48_9APHY|nr:uncharacterized protein FIBRA_04374 [Fibroporia radiculosa]CCM02286.1 predicted protein [Fibroporia radiculosa]
MATAIRPPAKATAHFSAKTGLLPGEIQSLVFSRPQFYLLEKRLAELNHGLGWRFSDLLNDMRTPVLQAAHPKALDLLPVSSPLPDDSIVSCLFCAHRGDPAMVWAHIKDAHVLPLPDHTKLICPGPPGMWCEGVRKQHEANERRRAHGEKEKVVGLDKDSYQRHVECVHWKLKERMEPCQFCAKAVRKDAHKGREHFSTCLARFMRRHRDRGFGQAVGKGGGRRT